MKEIGKGILSIKRDKHVSATSCVKASLSKLNAYSKLPTSNLDLQSQAMRA